MENNILEQEEQIAINKVRLNREWGLWENYDVKPEAQKIDYSKAMKEIYSFGTIIDFWQFWNIYPGAIPENIFYDGQCTKYFFKEKYRIIAIGLFTKGIRPEWEDAKNIGGKIFSMDYLVNVSNSINESFLNELKKGWTKLVLSSIGEVFDHSEHINGIRLVDKSQVGRKIIFRFEVWLNKDFPADQVDVLKKKLAEEFGCSGITSKDIPIPK